jgi:hypothetical protein
MHQRGILNLAVAIIALLCTRTASADEILTFHLVMTDSSSVQLLDVGDVEGHVLGLSRRSGVALFPDASVAGSYCSITTDFIKAAGPFFAYCNLKLTEGSMIWFKVTGFAKPEETTTVFPDSQIAVLRGTGRFDGFTGDGTFKGRLTPFALGANPYGDVLINLRK